MLKAMWYGFVVLFLIGAGIAAFDRAKPKWYSGGTLHGASAEEWQKGNAANRLATAADWTTGYIGSDNFQKVGESNLKKMAQNVVECVDVAVAEVSSMKISAREAALGCMTIMKYPRKK